MEMGSRGGASRAQLSTHGTPCFLNPLDTPTQEEPPFTSHDDRFQEIQQSPA